jgi:hypothetical protein
MATEEQILKALSEMEAIAKGGSGKLPKSTSEANGGLSNEGDKGEMSVSAKKGGKTLAQWVQETDESDAQKGAEESDFEDEDEDVFKAESDDDDESSSDDEDEESSSDDESEDEPPMKKGKARKSSISDLMKSDSSAGPVIDISPFIEGLVDQVSDSDMGLRKAVVALQNEQRAFNRAQSKVLSLMAKSMIAMQERMEGFENLPAGGRRSVVSKSEIDERFDEGVGSAGFAFNRDQVLDAMTELVKSHQIEPIEVTRYEVTSSMEQDTQRKVEQFLNKSA